MLFFQFLASVGAVSGNKFYKGLTYWFNVVQGTTKFRSELFLFALSEWSIFIHPAVPSSGNHEKCEEHLPTCQDPRLVN